MSSSCTFVTVFNISLLCHNFPVSFKFLHNIDILICMVFIYLKNSFLIKYLEQTMSKILEVLVSYRRHCQRFWVWVIYALLSLLNTYSLCVHISDAERYSLRRAIYWGRILFPWQHNRQSRRMSRSSASLSPLLRDSYNAENSNITICAGHENNTSCVHFNSRLVAFANF